jgi:sulfite exporter TauE/SafE/copper chaperone CopZ
MKEVTLPIKGMHCASCEILITDELEALPDVQKANVSLRTKSATIYLKRPIPRAAVIRAVEDAGYEVGYDDRPLFSRNIRVYKDLAIGLVIVTVLLLLFTKLGINNLSKINTKGASVGLVALMLGLTAGFSTCMALIGGLVLSMSSRHAEKHPTATPMQKFRPHLFFNLGRIVSFVILGGVIGGIGSAFQLKGGVLGLLTAFVGVVMLLLGLQLTELFPRMKGALTLPSSISKFFGINKRASREYSHTDSMLLGAATFFLPCGFTQAMQLYAVSTGSITSGALIMGLFALGTAPGLLSIGGLTSVVKGSFAQRFFRVVGVVVVMMALVNFNTASNLIGVKRWFAQTPKPVASVQPTQKQNDSSGTLATPSSVVPQQAVASTGPNILKTTFTLNTDIVPSKFTTKVGQETKIVVDVLENGQGCMSTIMIPGLYDTPIFLQKGKKLELTFTATKAGDYTITCAMGVPRGTVTVTQ